MESSLFLLSQYQLNTVKSLLEECLEVMEENLDLSLRIPEVLKDLRNSESILVSEYLAINKSREEAQ